jgi:hypothetical protein
MGRRLLAVLGAWAVGWGVLQGSATAAIMGAGFELKLGPSDRLLAAIGTAMEHSVWMQESCDNPHNRVRANNKPALMLTNTSTGVGKIQSFTMTINSSPGGSDVPYIFGTGDSSMDVYTGYVKKSLYSTDGVSITGSSISADKSTLTVTFADFSPGRRVLFNVDLDPESPSAWPFPDFRNVLHGAPLQAGGTPTDPADVLVRLVDETTDNVSQLTAMLEQITDMPLYSNANVRPYQVMNPMEVTEVAVSEIPEPAAAILLGLAVAGTVARRRR